jgi:hypothetical protein
MDRSSDGAASAAMRATARSLSIDAVSAEIVTRLRAAGIRPILLKGPSLATWLYADGTPRPYTDTDLLVSPRDHPEAERMLAELGFERGRSGWQEVSFAWRRVGDGSLVDLHSSLFGVEATPEKLWTELVARTESIRVGGAEVEAPNRGALAFHIALHAAQHGGDGGKPLEDLARALERASEVEWVDASALAAVVDAEPVFAAGLRRIAAGAGLATRLGLPDASSATIALHAEGAAPLVRGIEHVATAPNWAARLRFLRRKLMPPGRELRRRSALARRGRAALPLAYLLNALGLVARAPAALVAWRRARSAPSQE